jgi:hypothetical protein
MTRTRSNQALTPAQMFFYSHGGWNYASGSKETSEQGHVRCAIELERAETEYLDAHRVDDVRFEFEPDNAFPREPGCMPDHQWQATLYHGDHVLATLGGIDDDSSEYRRVVRAELALEASDDLRLIAAAAHV